MGGAIVLLIAVSLPILLMGLFVFDRTRRYVIPAAITVVVLGIAIFGYFVRPWNPVGQPLLIDEATIFNGHSVKLVQEFTGTWSEPYYVSLFVMPAGEENWLEFYMNHEDLYWTSGQVLEDMEHERVIIIRGRREVAVLEGPPTWPLHFTSGRTGKPFASSHQDPLVRDGAESARGRRSPMGRGAVDNTPPGYEYTPRPESNDAP